MPWVRARLRDAQVYARARADGSLLAEGGRVEVRYNPQDGRAYRAAARNLQVVDPTPLPDDTCAPAEPVAAAGARTAARKKKPDRVTGPPPPTEAADGQAIAYTDGACSGNPGPAGLGVVVLCGAERVELSEYLGQATNNIAELTAVLRALELVDPATPALVHTDSSYSIGVLQKGWKAKANVKLVATIRDELARHGNVKLVYVRGHAGVELNERADELARLAIETRSTRKHRRAAELANDEV